MKRLCTLMLCLLLPAAAWGAGEALGWVDVPALLRPGKTVRLMFTAPAAGPAEVTVLDSAGAEAAAPWAGEADAGENALYWDGRSGGADLSPGAYTLQVTQGAQTAQTALNVGTAAPELLRAEGDAAYAPGWTLTVECSMAGELAVTIDGEEALRQAVAPGVTSLPWDGTLAGEALPPGTYELEVRLLDSAGFSSTAMLLEVEIPGEPEPLLMRDAYSLLPSDVSCDHEVCYWKLYRGETDPERLWEVLTAPITVLEGDERQQAKVYAQPSDQSQAIAEVTYQSQAVHVLEQGPEWTKIEGYSSSVEGSSVANYAGHFVGYVQTALLTAREVSQEVGIVIDKLSQRLYVYQNGALLSTLLCSTGFPSQEAPWNETPSGEYVIISRTGGFWSGNLYCDMGLRINDGILLHEVPCQIDPEDQSRDYSRCERYLGEKASHGCIRIQRRLTPEGVNMQWLWDNARVGVKVIIWDEIGRELIYPEDAVPLYYNPDNGRQFHSSAMCRAVRSEYLPLTPFTWGQLEEEPFASLDPCLACAPQPRMAAIDEMNAKNTRSEERGW